MSQTESGVAEQMVGMSMRAMESLSRLLASGAKNLAVFLFTMAKDTKKMRGKVNLRAFLDDGRDYKTVDVDKSKIREFVRHLKDNDLMCHVVSHTKLWEDTIPVMIHAEDAARVNRIMEAMALADMPRQAKQQTQPEQQQNPTTGRTASRSQPRSRFRPSAQKSNGRESTANTSPVRLRPSVMKNIQRMKQARRTQQAPQAQPAQSVPQQTPQAPAWDMRDDQVMDVMRQLLAAITAITQEIAQQQTTRETTPPIHQAGQAPASQQQRTANTHEQPIQATGTQPQREAENRGQPAQGNPFRGEGTRHRSPVAQRMAAARSARTAAQPAKQQTIKPRGAQRGGR